MSTTTPPRVRVRRPHPSQRAVIDQARRFNVVDCGRRWGKTILGEERLARPAVEGYPVGWFSPTYKMLGEAWRDLKGLLAPVTRAKSEQDHRLELVTGGVVECWSLDDADPGRGRKYARVVIDEAAMVKNLADAWELAIRPTLTDYAGDAWFLSTPRGLNAFYALFQRGQDPAESEWQSWQMPTSGNPFIRPEEIAAAQAELPERAFAQEYLAQFLADGAGVFRRVQEACILDPQPPQDGHTYVAGVDWGKHEDFTVISVLDATTCEQVHLERTNRIDYVVQLERLMTVIERYRPRQVVAEANSMGEPLIEHLTRRGLRIIPWTATNATKAAVIEGLALALEREQVKLLRDRVQMGELLAYDTERLPSGLLRYGAPAGMHDDCVMALALAWTEAAPERQMAARLFGQAASVTETMGVPLPFVPPRGRTGVIG